MSGTTKTVDEVLETFLASAATPSTLINLIADDAVIEFPYALPDRLQKLTGKQEIVPYFMALKDTIAIDEMRRVAVHRTTDPNIVIVQSEGKGHAVQTGQTFEQKYISVLSFRDGLLVRVQDYWNPFTVFAALGGTIAFPKSERKQAIFPT
jgi:ketosteroid isomerase-like protein